MPNCRACLHRLTIRNHGFCAHCRRKLLAADTRAMVGTFKDIKSAALPEDRQ